MLKPFLNFVRFHLLAFRVFQDILNVFLNIKTENSF